MQVRVWRFDLRQLAGEEFQQVADFSCATIPEGLCVNETHVALLSQGKIYLMASSSSYVVKVFVPSMQSRPRLEGFAFKAGHERSGFCQGPFEKRLQQTPCCL